MRSLTSQAPWSLTSLASMSLTHLYALMLIKIISENIKWGKKNLLYKTVSVQVVCQQIRRGQVFLVCAELSIILQG